MAAIKYRYATEGDVPEKFKELYKEVSGVWVIDCEGASDKEKLKEFRDSNTKLLKDLEEIKERFEGIDPVVSRSLQAENEKLKAAATAAGGKGGKASEEEIEAKINERLKTQKADLDKQIEKLVKERDSANAELSRVVVEDSLITAATRKGVKGTAVEDVVRRGKEVFRLEGGKPIPYRGTDKIYGKDQIETMSVEEWMDGLAGSAPHLFAESNGGGATNGSSGGAGSNGQKNPFKKETFNLTEQGRLLKSNPQLAASLKAAAGLR
jgi:hypothetical protein